MHEAGATALAKYAIQQQQQPQSSPSSSASSSAASTDGASDGTFVMVLAPIANVRFMNGINGRLPRLCKLFSSTDSAAGGAGNSNTNTIVTEDAVTTILLNPMVASTLSKTNYLHLEIGTGPKTLPYHSKIANYLWFSATQSPKVNMIPRLMN